MLPIASLVITYLSSVENPTILSSNEMAALARLSLQCLANLDPLGSALVLLRTSATIADMGHPIIDEWSKVAHFPSIHRATRSLINFVTLLRNGMALSATTLFSGK